MADRQIDAISVGVGLNLSHVRSDLQRIQGEVRRVSSASQDSVYLPLRLGYRTESGLKPELRKFRRQIEKQLSVDQNNAIHVPIQLRIGKQDIREARRTLEQGFGQNPVHVPIQIQVQSLATFRASIEAAFKNAPIEVEVVAKRRGGGGGGGGGDTPPTSGGRRSGGGGGGAGGGGASVAVTPPTPIRNAPARGRAQRPAPAVVVPSTMSPAQHAATQPGAAWPVQEPTPAGAPPASPRQARRTQEHRARQERAQASPGTGLSGPTGPRKTNLPPSSGRMSIDELRFAPRQEELQGEERAQYAGQTRARPTPARGQAEQPGERHTVRGPGGRRVSRIVPGASSSAHRRQEEMAQASTRKAREAWKNSPEYKALPRLPGGELDVSSFVGFGDEWKRMYEAASDPEASFTMEDVRDIRRLTSEENRRRFGVEGREGTGKRGARSMRRTRKIRAGRVSTERMTDRQLVEDAALGALGAEVATQVNPLQHVKSGDTKGRGKGGKIGRIGGRGAGQLASESVDIDAVRQIIERRRVGGQGNGWKTLRDEFDRADISRAQGILRDRADQPEAEPIVPGRAYGGGAEMYARGEAPSVPGGQGISRDDESPAKRAAETRSRQANREARKREDELPRSGRSPGSRPAPLGQTVRPERATRTAGWEDLVGDRARRPVGAAGTDPRDRTSGAFPGYSAESTGETSFGRNRNNPPRQNMGGGPTARNTGYRYQERGHRAGWESFQREFRGGRGTAERPPIDTRIDKLKRMAGQMAQSPHEATIAAEMLRRLRIPGYAEGGVLGLSSKGPWTSTDLNGPTRHQPPASVFLQQFAKTGEPGIHEEPGPTKDPDYLDRYVVARDEKGRAIGRVSVRQTAPGYHGAGTTRSVHPYVDPGHRRKGIASAMYRYAEDSGMDVERVSKENYEGHFQTQDGRAFYEGRHGREGHLAEGGVGRNWGRFVAIDLSGSIPGRVLGQAFPEISGNLPRPGSHRRKELERDFKVGVRNRRKYDAKPDYQKGGKSGGSEWLTNRKLFLEQERTKGPLTCAICGEPTIEGDKQWRPTVDHIVDTASGGTHALSNLQIAHNAHNGWKSGGRSARYKVGERGPDKRAEGGPLGGDARNEHADRMFGDRPGMWWNKATGSYSYAHERPSEQDRTEEANQAFRGSRYSQAGQGRSSGWQPQMCPCGHDRAAHSMFGGSACGRCSCPAFGSPKGSRARTEAPAARASEDTRSKTDKLRAMADQSVSPNEAEVARRMLHDRGVEGYADGGTLYERVQRARLMSQGLPERAASGSADADLTVVGERGPEGILTDRNTGQTHVIPAHKLPMWLQRAQEGKGFAKDMTGRAEGGPLRVNRAGNYYETTARGARGVTAEGARVGPVARVFVVNWPPVAGMGNINAAAQQAARAHAAAPVAPPLVNAQGQPLVFAGAAGGGAAAQPAPGTGTRTKLSPLQKVEARRAGAASTEDVQMRLDEIRSGISESLQQAPVRALSVAFGQIAQTAIGGRAGILKRAGIARRQLARASKETTALEGLEGTGSERLGELRSLRQQAPSPARDQRIAEIRTELGTQIRPAIQAQRAVVAERADQAAEAQGKILSKGQLVKAQGVGLVGIIAGTQAFTMAIAGLTAAETAAAAALGPLVDEMLGWPAAIDKVTAAVRDNMQTSAGNMTQGLAATFGQTGVSAQYLAQQGQGAGMSGMARAAQLRAGQTLDLTRAAASPTQNRGLYEGTGGLFGSNFATSVFGGQEGFLQSIVKRLEVNRGEINTGAADSGALGLFPNDRATYNDDVKWMRENTTNGKPNALVSPGDVTQTRGRIGRFEAAEGAPGRQAATIADLNKNLESAATYAGDASKSFKLLTESTGATKDQLDAMVKSAEATNDAGAIARAKELRGMGIAVTRGGQGLQGAEFGGYAEAQARGQLIDNPQVLLDQTQNQRRAQAQLIQAQAQAQRQEDIPAQFAMGQIAAPLHQFGLGVSTANLQGPYGAETQANIAKYQKMAEGANEDINKAIEQGRKAMNDIVGRAGPDALREFTGITSEIERIGKQIKDTQDPLTVRQTAYEAKEYAEQLRLGTRSLGDAKDFFAAIQGATMDTVGGLQGQNALLDRQNQLLGRRAQQLSFKSEDIGFKSSDLQAQLQMLQFAQAQRQINFSKATAGFTAPGDTPEERSARIKQAKIEASEAQRQLNLQRQIFAMSRQQLGIARQQLALNRQMVGNQNRQQDNSWRATFKDAERSVGDLQKQMDLLAEGHAITVDTKGAEDAIGRLVKQQDLLNSKAQSYLSEGAEIRGQLLGTAAEVSAATGKAFGLLVRDVNNAWNAAFAGYTVRWAQLVNSINGTQTGGGTGGGGSKTKATGGIDTVNHATKFVAGEAGTESVIVLRNPQQGFLQMMAGGDGRGGGGGGNTYLYVTGNNVSSDKELDHLVYRIERKLNQSLGLAGLRNRD